MAVALSVSEVVVRSLDVESREVSWELPITSIDARDYTFQVLRSESPRGPFEPVSEPFIDRYLFVDRRLPVGNKWRQLWYTIRTRHRVSDEFVDSAPATQEANPDLLAQYARREQQLLLTRFTGRACWLFKKRTFGTRCTSCWDIVLKKRTRSSCYDCYDTGFLRGYLNPIEIWVQIDPPGQSKQNLATQIENEVYTSARMSYFPNVSVGDVLVELENIRWRVTRITRSERLRAPVKQELVLLQVQNTDIEYRLPVNVDEALRDIQPTAGKTFTNPTDLQTALEERTPNVFAVYPTYPRREE
jgi:hypothetical protein